MQKLVGMALRHNSTQDHEGLAWLSCSGPDDVLPRVLLVTIEAQLLVTQMIIMIMSMIGRLVVRLQPACLIDWPRPNCLLFMAYSCAHGDRDRSRSAELSETSENSRSPPHDTPPPPPFCQENQVGRNSNGLTGSLAKATRQSLAMLAFGNVVIFIRIHRLRPVSSFFGTIMIATWIARFRHIPSGSFSPPQKEDLFQLTSPLTISSGALLQNCLSGFQFSDTGTGHSLDCSSVADMHLRADSRTSRENSW